MLVRLVYLKMDFQFLSPQLTPLRYSYFGYCQNKSNGFHDGWWYRNTVLFKLIFKLRNLCAKLWIENSTKNDHSSLSLRNYCHRMEFRFEIYKTFSDIQSDTYYPRLTQPNQSNTVNTAKSDGIETFPFWDFTI